MIHVIAAMQPDAINYLPDYTRIVLESTVLQLTGIEALRVLLSFPEYCCNMGVLLYFTLDAGLLTRIQLTEGPATGHLNTGFPWFPCVCLKANAEMVPNIPRCHYMLLL